MSKFSGTTCWVATGVSFLLTVVLLIGSTSPLPVMPSIFSLFLGWLIGLTLISLLSWMEFSLWSRLDIEKEQVAKLHAYEQTIQVGQETVAQRNLRQFHRFIIPGVTFLLAGIETVALVYAIGQWRNIIQPTLKLSIVWIIVSIGGYLLGNYMLDYTRRLPDQKGCAWVFYALASEWVGLSVFGGLTSIVMGVLSFYPVLWLTRALLVCLLGVAFVRVIEKLMNILVEMYRYYNPDEFHALYSSRIGRYLANPVDFIQYLSEALYYHFGICLTQKELKQWIGLGVPLLIGGQIILFVFSTSMVIVRENEEAIEERWGNPVRIIKPGFSWKAPWPWGEIRRYSLSPLSLKLSDIPDRVDQWYDESASQLPVTLFFSPETGNWALGRYNLLISYRIRDLYSYAYRSLSPQNILLIFTYRAMSYLSLSTDFHQLIKSDQIIFAEKLRSLLNDWLTDQKLGIFVDTVALYHLQPDPSIIDSYLQVMREKEHTRQVLFEAEREKLILITQAMIQAASSIASAQVQKQNALIMALTQVETFKRLLPLYQNHRIIFQSLKKLELLEEEHPGKIALFLTRAPSQVINLELKKKAKTLFELTEDYQR